MWRYKEGSFQESLQKKYLNWYKNAQQFELMTKALQ